MNNRSATGTMERWAYVFWLGCAGLTAVSLPAARVCLVLSLLLLIADAVRNRRRPWIPVVTWMAMAFACVAVVSTFVGVHPEIGVPKLRKLIWFVAIPVSARLVHTPVRLRQTLTAVAVGAGVLSLERCVLVPWAAWGDVRSGAFARFFDALVHRGSMTDGQSLMLGILASMGLIWTCGRRIRCSYGWWALLGFQCLALVLNFKRGSWICTLVVALLLLAMRCRRRYVVMVLAAVCVMACLPWTQARLAGLKDEFHAGGGRMTMWTEITPALIVQHPWLGVGYRSLTNDMMREIAPNVERDRDHVHSNPLQVLVETGVVGFVFYAVWMLWALGEAAWFARLARNDSGGEGVSALIVSGMLAALLLNGLVEYNFADGELVLAYGLLMGCAAAGRVRQKE